MFCGVAGAKRHFVIGHCHGVVADCLALTDFYRLWRGEIWLSGENFVPLHCQKRGRPRAAIKEKNCEN